MSKICFARVMAITLIAMMAVGGLSQGNDQKADFIRRDRAMIQGKWRVVLLVDDGKVSKPEDASKVFVVNGNDGTWAMFADGKAIAKGPSTIDPTATPRTIDFHITEDNGKRVDFLGIYELGTSKRKLCFAPKDKGRPKAFEATKASGNILVEFEKMKD